MVEAMVVLEMIVGVELGSPRFCWIGAANGVGVIPVGFGDEVPVAFAVGDCQVSSGRVVDVDFGASAQAENGGDGGKEFTKLAVAEGDWLGAMCCPGLAGHGF